MGGLIEIPMGDTLRLRGEAAVALWPFDGYSTYGIAGSGMRRHRLAVSVLRSQNPASPERRRRSAAARDGSAEGAGRGHVDPNARRARLGGAEGPPAVERSALARRLDITLRADE